MSTVGEVKQFYGGYEIGLRLYAYWKDGVQYVGSCGTTLEKALAQMKEGMAIDLKNAVADRDLEIDFVMEVIEGLDGNGLVQTEEYGIIRERVAEYIPEPSPTLPNPWMLGVASFEGWSGKDTANWQAEERAADAHLDDSDQEEI